MEILENIKNIVKNLKYSYRVIIKIFQANI